MDVRQLRYLVAVVDEGSISRAAARLNMSQPPLSTAIAQLERELGVVLLDRHARGVEPTEAGGYLVEHARRLLASLAEVSAAVVAVGTGRRGHIALAAVSGTAWEVLPGALRAFSRDHPEVEIDIVDAPPAEVVDRVRARRADVGLLLAARSDDVERLHGRELEAAMVRREPLVAVLPAEPGVGDPVDMGGPVDLADLADRRWLATRDDTGFPALAEVVDAAWRRAGVTPPVGRTVATLDTAVRLVGAGLGVALMPASVRRVAGPQVLVRPLALHLPPIETVVVWRRHEKPSPVLARFLRTVLSTPEPDRLGPAVARRSTAAGSDRRDADERPGR